jgi:hypothetical protein
MSTERGGLVTSGMLSHRREQVFNLLALPKVLKYFVDFLECQITTPITKI